MLLQAGKPPRSTWGAPNDKKKKPTCHKFYPAIVIKKKYLSMLMTFKTFFWLWWKQWEGVLQGETGSFSSPKERCELFSVGIAEFLQSLFEVRLNLRKIRCGRRDQWKNPCGLYGTNLWKSSFLNCIFSQPEGRKIGVFLRAVVGIGSEFHGIYLQELLLSLMWSLGCCVSILKMLISFCVQFCANKKWLFFCLWPTPVM